MHCFIMLIFLWFLHWSNLNGKDIAFPEITDIISNAQYLCPRTSFCDEPPLSQTPLPKGKISCCRGCSCKQGCVKKNDCCFPPKSSESKANASISECLYPAVSQRSVRLLRGTQFKMVVDVTNCTPGTATVETLSKNNKFLLNNDSTCKQKVRVGNCLCDKEDGCSCGDAKVAPWGSMLPVYSKRTGLIYKNSVCAACHGVNDGLIWTPVIMCLGIDFKYIENVIDESSAADNDCIIYFKEPENSEMFSLPRCLEMKRCKNSNFPIPYGLNMSAQQVINMCESNFNSPYNGKEKNVFCAICSDSYIETKSICQSDDDHGVKVSGGGISFLLTLDFMKEISANSETKNHPTACTSMTPPDCRAILCSTGQIRYANGACKYPMAATYVTGYTVTIRLIPIENRFLLDLETLVLEGKISFEHFLSPWPRKWLNMFILLERTRLMSSGRLKNITSFITRMALPDPVKNQALVLRNVRRLLEMKWILKVKNTRVRLRSEFFEYSSIFFDKSKNIFFPASLHSLETILPTPVWIQVSYRGQTVYPGMEKFSKYMLITKMMFCEQILLDPQFDSYTLMAKHSLLYNESKKKYIFEGNFAYDKNGRRKVHICLEDTDFVKQVASMQTRNTAGPIIVIYIWINVFLI